MRGLFKDESGLTLIELLVASAMSVVIVGAGASMMISAVRSQPQLSERNQKVTEVRYVQERMTKELRNAISIAYEDSSATTVSFVTQIRTSACGGGVPLDEEAPAIECQVTYDCSSGDACTRAEAAKNEIGGGIPRPLIGGLESGAVFDYFPDLPDPEEDLEEVEPPTYVGITFRAANPSGSGSLTVSDGASLRTSVLRSSG